MWNEYSTIKKVAVRTPENAFLDQSRIDRDWENLRFLSAPDLANAIKEHRKFVSILEEDGAEVVFMPGDDALTLDSIYVRDAALVTPKGLILCRMGRKTRRGEPSIHGRHLPGPVLGTIEAPGTLEGGDFIWLDQKTAAVGLGPRTNQAGIDQLKVFLGPAVELHVVPLPAPSHPEDVMHLMSMISPVDKDLAVIYRPLMPGSFVDWLAGKGIRFIEVPEDEFPKMECNVLAIAPRKAIMVEGCPKTAQLLKDAGCSVTTFPGSEISFKGGGGPTCLTRPLVRGAS